MTSTTSYTAGEFVLAVIPYSSGAQAKVRPALVVFDAGNGDVVVARATTQPHATPWDVVVADWRAAGLLGPAVIRLHKLATIEKALIHKRIGLIQPADRIKVTAVLKQMFGNW